MNKPRGTTFWIFFWVLFVAALIMAAYLLLAYRHEKTATSGLNFDIGYSVKTAAGTSWYEVTPQGSQSYPTLSGMSINGMAHADGKTFVLAFGNASSSTLYEYANGTYTPLYTSSTILRSLSVSNDGTWAVFLSNNSEVEAFNLMTKTMAQVGPGFGLALVQAASGSPTVLYLNGKTILASAPQGNAWSAPQPVYTSGKDFAMNDSVVSDGSDRFAFREPFVNKEELWQVKSWAPLTISPLKIYNIPTNTPFTAMSLVNSELTGLLLITPSSTTPSDVMELTTFASTTASNRLRVPLQNATQVNLVFVQMLQ